MRLPMLALLLIACGAVHSSTSVDYAAAVAGPGRPADMLKFDARWKPAAVLEFLQLEPRMHVLDIIADGGYYSEIMARVVGPKGQVVALVYDEKARNDFAPLRERNPNISFQILPMHTIRADSLTPDHFDFVLLNMMYHDVYWEDDKAGAPHVDPENVLAALYRAVKPGGIVGVIDFVGEPGDPRVIVNRLHRIDPARARADFERAGFVFEGQSDLLHVANDDHTMLVFDPAIRGKTDKFVSRFRKPRTR
jgi:predicted methyltransferase